MNPATFSRALLAWYDQNGRSELPWRQEISAYRVWVSEIMLQQTQVQTVIPYFHRFIARFPCVESLAQASEDEVLHLWTGLGYYARARNLHRAAKQIHAHFDGQFPQQLSALQSLPGIGLSTAGAISAIAMQQRAAILDGNVKRVLTRFHALNDAHSAKGIRQLWEYSERYIPHKRVDDYTQAIMDLGALICTRSQPKCPECPLKRHCEAFQQGRVAELPAPKPRKQTPLRAVRLLIFHDQKQNAVLLEKRPPVGIWGGLWSFPECPVDVDLEEWCRKERGLHVLKSQALPSFQHVFTHFRLTIIPIHITKTRWPNTVKDNTQIWHILDQPSPGGFSAPVRRLLTTLKAL